MIELLLIIIGLVIGSFLNVVIVRVSQPKNIFRGRSKCTSCKTEIKAYDLIPLVSFVILKSKCRNCKKAISWQYPLVELFTALTFYLLFLKFGFTIFFALSALLFSVLIAIFVIDLKTQYIPDFLNYLAIIIAIIIFFINSGSYLNLLYGILFGAGFFLFQFLISKGRWIGLGDIFLGLTMGILLGWYNVVLAIYIAYIIGAIVSVILLTTKKITKNAMIAFGPFLIFSTFLVYLYGDYVLNYYLSLIL